MQDNNIPNPEIYQTGPPIVCYVITKNGYCPDNMEDITGWYPCENCEYNGYTGN